MTKPYHHGDLAPALLAAAEEILVREGAQALTLRAVARRTGVSHMAPAHHFGDLEGLLSELAALGYRRFSARLEAALDDPGRWTPSRALGQAYVAFAQDNPGLFQLMFQSGRLDFERPALAEAARGASMALLRGKGAEALAGQPGRVAIARAVFEWSLVHGFAMLLIDGRLDPIRSFAGVPDAATLLDEAFDAGFS